MVKTYTDKQIYTLISCMQKELRIKLNRAHIDATERLVIKAQIVQLGKVLDKLGIQNTNSDAEISLENLINRLPD